MMKLITQDGRTLLIKDGDKVEFKALLYCGHVQRGYVSAGIQPVGLKNVRYDVTLGEYDTPEWDKWSIAEKATKAVREAFESGATVHIMHGNNGVALSDDLMQSIVALDTLYAQISPKGWWLEFGMIDGVTNSSWGINPDKDGSYAKDVEACYEKFIPMAGKTA